MSEDPQSGALRPLQEGWGAHDIQIPWDDVFKWVSVSVGLILTYNMPIFHHIWYNHNFWGPPRGSKMPLKGTGGSLTYKSHDIMCSNEFLYHWNQFWYTACLYSIIFSVITWVAVSDGWYYMDLAQYHTRVVWHWWYITRALETSRAPNISSAWVIYRTISHKGQRISELQTGNLEGYWYFMRGRKYRPSDNSDPCNNTCI